MPKIDNGVVGFFGAMGIGNNVTLAQRFIEGMQNTFYGASHNDNVLGQAIAVVEGSGTLSLYDGDVDNDTNWLGKFKQLTMGGATEFKQRMIEEIAKDKNTRIVEGEVAFDDLFAVIQTIQEDYEKGVKDAADLIIIDSLPRLSPVCPTMTDGQAEQAMEQIRNAVKFDREGSITDQKYNDTFERLVNKYNFNDTRLLYSLKDAEPREVLDDPVGESHYHGEGLPNDGKRVSVTLIKRRNQGPPVAPLIFTIENDMSLNLVGLMNYNDFDGNCVNEVLLDEISDYKNVKDVKPKYKFNKHNGGMTMQSNHWYDVGHKRGKGGSKKRRKG